MVKALQTERSSCWMEESTACSRQMRRLPTDPTKMIRFNKDKQEIICYKSNQSSTPSQTRDLDPHLNRDDFQQEVCLHTAMFVLSWYAETELYPDRLFPAFYWATSHSMTTMWFYEWRAGLLSGDKLYSKTNKDLLVIKKTLNSHCTSSNILQMRYSIFGSKVRSTIKFGCLSWTYTTTESRAWICGLPKLKTKSFDPLLTWTIPFWSNSNRVSRPCVPFMLSAPVSVMPRLLSPVAEQQRGHFTSSPDGYSATKGA